MAVVLEVIPKERLSEIQFAKEDVLTDPVKRRLRDIYLKKAERLGNEFKGKVRMVFKTRSEKIYAVDTTIWAANEEYITIKGGVNIPTRSVLDIEFSA